MRLWSLEEAVAAARTLARPGDLVLLSPGGTSFDQYPNFEARGKDFKRVVNGMPEVARQETRQGGASW